MFAYLTYDPSLHHRKVPFTVTIVDGYNTGQQSPSDPNPATADALSSSSSSTSSATQQRHHRSLAGTRDAEGGTTGRSLAETDNDSITVALSLSCTTTPVPPRTPDYDVCSMQRILDVFHLGQKCWLGLLPPTGTQQLLRQDWGVNDCSFTVSAGCIMHGYHQLQQADTLHLHHGCDVKSGAV
jgi:hypothetical protein